MVIVFAYRPEEHIDFQASPVKEHKAPNCMEFIHLEYSPHAFEHLEVRATFIFTSCISGETVPGLLSLCVHA